MVPRLPVEYAVLIILVFVAIFVVHFVRRAYRQPIRSEPKQLVHETIRDVKMYDSVQRVYHWVLFVTLGIMLLTGLSLYVPGVFNSWLIPFGIQSSVGELFWHTTMVWVLLGLLVIHIVWDLAATKQWKNIWFRVRDIKDVFTRGSNFFGRTKTYPRPGKYDIFMKTLHWGFALSLVVLGITGIFMWNPYGIFPGINAGTDSLFRILHDIFTFLFLGLVMGHIYFSVIPANWRLTRAMFTGSVTKETYEEEYNPERYPLPTEHKRETEKKQETKGKPEAK